MDIDLCIQDSRLQFLVESAVEAGDLAESLKTNASQERKANGTIVTEADQKAEDSIRDAINSFSDYHIVGEEDGGEITDADTYWVIDPIDGTRNFSYQQPFYGTAIAFVEDNEPTAGVFYMPELDNVFYACEDKGAYRNRTKLSVTDKKTISDSYVILSGKGRTEIQPGVSELTKQNQQLGSAVMGEGWISSGWADVGVYGALAPWDMAVGQILVKEAGGVMKEISTTNQMWDSVAEGKVVFGNESIVDEFISQLPDYSIQAALDAVYEY